MMLDFSMLMKKYQPVISGVIHVGAHKGQEYKDYHAHNINSIIFIEPLEVPFKVLKGKFGESENILLFNCACADSEGNKQMHVDMVNEGQSSSLLEPLIHLEEHPDIPFPNKELVPVKRLDDLPFTRSKYNLLVMDTQGTELLVLKGAKETLKYIDYIYTEVNIREVYKDCVQLPELDDYLQDFERVETFIAPKKSWGDAFYIRKGVAT
jgi:FkbM family methyltransferase